MYWNIFVAVQNDYTLVVVKMIINNIILLGWGNVRINEFAPNNV